MRTQRKPDWLKMRPPSDQRFTDIKSTLWDQNLNTACEEVDCLSLGECWSGRDGPGTATFMLMGDRCSRGCNFYGVTTGGMKPLDSDESANVANAMTGIDLDYVVLTSVDRDDLPNQGAAYFAEIIRKIKRHDPEVLVEVLIPDFQGDLEHVRKIIDAGSNVITHDIETIERLQWPIRDRRAGYEQPLSVLRRVTDESNIHTKISAMLGLGEHIHGVYQMLSDLCEVNVDIVIFGQYLQPSRSHLDVSEYVHPDAFETRWCVAEGELGFLYYVSGPMVQSSYKAGELFVDVLSREGSSVKEARQVACTTAGQQALLPSQPTPRDSIDRIRLHARPEADLQRCRYFRLSLGNAWAHTNERQEELFRNENAQLYLV